ncbi:hypothetical protein [Psychrosphaera algicola]|uniref:VCBS repeat-containing protein n=1 Tax=Psychrosphaera algicola TaxID=3023714 RepID=A0ABT5FG62_9GAMM|nr:hypothetical protein [Psychrosphaera sp. G1-22]MDC2890351.1 hypothetical protein [Psychrosphaera sp. G1-22]
MQSFCRWVPNDTDFEAFDTTNTAYSGAKNTEYTLIFDIDGNGIDDFVYPDGSEWKARLMSTNAVGNTVSLASWATNEKEHALTIDFNGDGIRDLLYATSDTSNWQVVSYILRYKLS